MPHSVKADISRVQESTWAGILSAIYRQMQRWLKPHNFVPGKVGCDNSIKMLSHTCLAWHMSPTYRFTASKIDTLAYRIILGRPEEFIVILGVIPS